MARANVDYSAIPQADWVATAGLGPFQYGTARFTLSPGAAAIVVSGLLGFVTGLRRVEKHDGQILVSHVRIRPPWVSTVIRLGPRAEAWVGSVAGRTVAERLRLAGFEVEEEWVWLRPSRGGLRGSAARIGR